MAQDKVIIRRSGHQVLDELDATDIPDLSGTYDVAGAAATAASGAASALSTHAGAADPHPGYLTPAEGNAAYDASGAAAAAQSAAIAAAATDATTKANAAAAASQPLDSDLTAIAALSTTSFGRGLLALADAAALRTSAGLGTAAVAATGDFDAAGAASSAQAAAIAASQPLDSDLTAIAALSTTSYGRSLLAAADAAALRTLAGLGTLATQSGTFSGTSSGTNTGDQTLPTRASLVLATTDTPQFAGIEVGAASDTTLARVSAGVISVEGATILVSGGALGTPASGTATNLTGTAASLTAGNATLAATVTTNANLTGDVTSSGNATTISASKATGKFGRSSHGGTVDYQLPGVALASASSTVTMAINTLWYQLQNTPTQIVIDQVAFNVTTGPASNANVRVGIYTCTTDNQPSGAPLVDVTVAVATAFTGVKTISASATIPPGPFIIASNVDVAMTIRSWRGPLVSGFIDSTLGSGLTIHVVSVASTYGVMPNPGTAWTTIQSAVGDHPIVIRVLTP